MSIPGSWRGVRNKLTEAPSEIQQYFEPAAELMEHYSWEVSLSYLFARLERAHLMSLYCGVVKLHRVDSELAATAVEKFENKRDDFRELFKRIFGKQIPNSLIDKIERAQQIRNNVLHGKKVRDRDYRMAIVSIVEYATEFNEICFDLGGFRPFGSLQGFKGAAASMDKSTSRWVLRNV